MTPHTELCTEQGATKDSRSKNRLLRRAFCIGLAGVAAAPLFAREGVFDSSRFDYSQPCSTAKAVHDRSCSNYTGFKSPTSESIPDTDAVVGEVEIGKRPAQASVGRTLQQGVASWYGPRFHGRLTANGERYDMHALTAAHKTLPFGTRVVVKNQRNGKTVVVRINDRGPFIKGRVIDLSKEAARRIDMLARGHAPVVLHEAVA